MAEPLAEWEREYLESARYRASREAATLRDAATILSERAKRKTFALEVIIRLLERTASKLDHPHRLTMAADADLAHLNAARRWWLDHRPWRGRVPTDAEVIEAYEAAIARAPETVIMYGE